MHAGTIAGHLVGNGDRNVVSPIRVERWSRDLVVEHQARPAWASVRVAGAIGDGKVVLLYAGQRRDLRMDTDRLTWTVLPVVGHFKSKSVAAE